MRTGTGWEAGFPETCSRLCFPEMPHRRWRNGTVAHSSGGRFREAVAIDRTAMLLAFPIPLCPTPSPPCYPLVRRPHIAASARNSMPPPAADLQRSARHRHVGFPLRTGRGDPACYPCAGGSPRLHFWGGGNGGPRNLALVRLFDLSYPHTRATSAAPVWRGRARSLRPLWPHGARGRGGAIPP